MGTVVCGAVEKTVQLWITLWLFHRGVWLFFPGARLTNQAFPQYPPPYYYDYFFPIPPLLCLRIGKVAAF